MRLQIPIAFFLALVSTLSPANTVHVLTLEESVCSADVVVAGTLSNITERYMSVSVEREPPRSIHLDKGYVRTVRVLKGKYRGTDVHYGVLFPSKGLQSALREKIDLSISGGEAIWFLHHEIIDGNYIVRGTSPPLPISRVDEVAKIVGASTCSFTGFGKPEVTKMLPGH